MEDQKNILLITNYEKNYPASIELLTKKYGIAIADSLDGANNYFKLVESEEKPMPDLIILESYMNYKTEDKKYTSEETNDGIETGIVYYNRVLKDVLKDKPTKVAFREHSDFLLDTLAMKCPKVPIIERNSEESHLVDGVNRILEKTA